MDLFFENSAQVPSGIIRKNLSQIALFLVYKALCITALNELHDNSDDEKNCCGEVKNFELLTSVKSQAKI